MTVLGQRARHHGTKSIFAGDEPRDRELSEHWPKGPKLKRPALSKREAKRRRKEKLIKHADEATYQGRLTAPWPILVRDEKGGS